MDADQIAAWNAIMNGHNLVLTGQAGTGKTFTIKHCVNELRKTGKNVALTCYTGIACLQYEGLKPMTLHKFAGLEDGRHPDNKLLHLLQTDERFGDVKKRIIETDVLIIDEVSMVSRKILESTEFLCRNLRGGTYCFGGLQVILCGDFYQLPPIQDKQYGDDGSYCMKSHFFEGMFPHVIHFQTVHRQREEKLIKCVSELEKGKPSKETNEFFSTLSRPLTVENESEVVKLFARNEDVDLYNYQKSMAMEGELKVFESEDKGDDKFLRKVLAPKRLGLKVNAPVMLLRNLNERHVNGLRGKVARINDASIDVNFKVHGKSEVVRIERFCFSKYDPATNKCIASRTQFPLKLAFGMTIHKAQGMSIEFVEVNCKKATFPGQVGVAVGRAQTSGGLRVLNYSQYLLKEHPKDVRDFYENYNPNVTYENDRSCCGNHECFQNENLHIVVDEIDSDSEIDELIDNVEQMENKSDHSYTMNIAVDTSPIRTILQSAFNDFKDTPSEATARNALDVILSKPNNVSAWYVKQCSAMENIYDNCCSVQAGNLKQKHLTDFYTMFQQYMVSEEYSQSIKSVSEVEFSSHLFSSVMFLIQEKILKDKAATVEITEQPVLSVFPSPDSTISAPGKGKIRYVGGYCVAKVRYRLCKSMRNCFYVPGMTPEINKIQEQINILDDMTISAAD